MVENCTLNLVWCCCCIVISTYVQVLFLLFKLLQLQHDVQDCRKITHHVFCPCHSHQHMFFMFANRLFSTRTYNDTGNLVCPVRKFGFSLACNGWFVHGKVCANLLMKWKFGLQNWPCITTKNTSSSKWNLGVVKEVVPLYSLFIHALSSYLFSLMLMRLSLLFEFVPHALSKWSQ